MVVEVTAEKLVEGLFTGGTEFIQNFHKISYTLSGKIWSGKSFRWGKYLSPRQHFFTFPRRKVFLRFNEYI